MQREEGRAEIEGNRAATTTKKMYEAKKRKAKGRETKPRREKERERYRETERKTEATKC